MAKKVTGVSAKRTKEAKGSSASVTGVGEDAVKEATGKSWAQWFAILDRKGASDLPHKEIAALLAGDYGVAPWWSQTVTVGYERARGLREKHEKPDGFSVSVSRVINAPVGAVFGAWSTAPRRRTWLGGHLLSVRKATANRSMRITWDADGTNVDVNFTVKGPEKCQLSVEHSRLAGAEDGARMKALWSEAIERLKTVLAKR